MNLGCSDAEVLWDFYKVLVKLQVVLNMEAGWTDKD